MNDILTVLEKLEENFASKAELYSNIKKEALLLIRSSSTIIQAIHRKEEVNITALREKYSVLHNLTNNKRELQYDSLVETAMQEYVEAELVYNYVKAEEIVPTPKSLGVTDESYILGLMDFTGELKRIAMIELKNGNLEKSSKIADYLEEIFNSVMKFDSFFVSPTFKRKQDVLRNTIERLEEEVSFLIMERTIIDELKKKT